MIINRDYLFSPFCLLTQWSFSSEEENSDCLKNIRSIHTEVIILMFLLQVTLDSLRVLSILVCFFFVRNFQALPYWDWTVIYDKECLIDNPYKVQDGLTEEDCSACQHLKGVKRIANASQSEIAESFLFNQIPVVVTDAVEGWDALEKFDLNYLAEVPRAIPFNNQPLPMGDSFWGGCAIYFQGGWLCRCP